jgi:hypothetical protein
VPAVIYQQEILIGVIEVRAHKPRGSLNPAIAMPYLRAM